VRVLVRPESAEASLPSEVVRITGSLTDRCALEALVSPADAVIHCAGAVRGAHEGDFMQVNGAAVADLVQLSAAASNVRHFLLLSSLAASQPEVSPYAASKLAGEQALERAAGRVAYTVLRPPAVYGPGDRELMPLFKAMARGLAPVWGNPEAKFSLIYIDDLVAAVVRCLQLPKPAGAVFELHDGRPGGYSMNDVVEIARAEFRRRVWRCRIPAVALDAVAGANLTLARFFGYQPMLTPWKLRELRYPRWVCDNTAFHAATGWNPDITLAQGLPLALRTKPDYQ
jgi:nucleoside-diphosphate-sugar epimerase